MPEITAYLRRHDFKPLFVEELGWDHDTGEVSICVRDSQFLINVIASKRGLRVLQTSANHFALFDRKMLRELQSQVFAHAHEHILIVSCDTPKKQVWMWATTSGRGKQRRHREHPFFSDAPPDGIITRLEAMRFLLDEEAGVSLFDASERVRRALDTAPELDLFVRRPWYARKSYQLAKARRDGGVQAFQQFVEFHLPLLPNASKRLWTFMRNLDQEDRLQIVALGLLRAASKYDEERGIQFSTYAHHWLRNAAQRHGPVCSRIVQIPHYHWRTRRLALEALRRLGARGDPESVMLAINALANDAPKLLNDWLQIERTAVILSIDDAKSPAFQESRMLPSPSGSMFTWQERLEANQVIFNALAHMDPRERAVIEMRFGLHGPSYTLQEIAACFNITRERVRQLEALTLEKLRRRLSRSFEAEPAADMSPCEATQSPASLQRQSDSIDGSLL